MPEDAATPGTPKIGNPKNPYKDKAFPITFTMFATIETIIDSFVYP